MNLNNLSFNFTQKKIEGMQRLTQLSSILVPDFLTHQDKQSDSKITDQITKYGDFSICYLEQCHREEVLELCIREFTNKHPLMQAYRKIDPNTNYQLAYRRFWDRIIDKFIGNRLSIVAIDSKTNQIAAATLSIDYLQTYSDVFSSELTADTFGLCAYEALRVSLLEKLKPQEHSMLETKGLFAESFVLVVDDKFATQKIISYMTGLVLPAMKSRGYQYAFAFTTNFISKYLAEKQGAVKRAECAADSFEFKGEKVFRMVEEEHNLPAILLRSLKDVPRL